MTELKTHECWVYDYGCRADMVDKADVDAALAEKDTEIRRLSFQLWSARCEAAKAEHDEPRLARCRYMADKFKEADK